MILLIITAYVLLPFKLALLACLLLGSFDYLQNIETD